jgi:1,4-dihydroxy-2-naphthoate polyprenyltransferase
MDRDTTPIGGLAAPPQPDRSLFYTTLLLDGLALFWALFINIWFAFGILIYILMSRLYSYRGIRLKQYPILGFLTVFLFQGAWVYFTTLSGVLIDFTPNLLNTALLLNAAIASLFIGAIYPLTQIYQHQSDLNDGVKTLSYQLGYRGTFAFSALLFGIGSLLMYWQLSLNQFIFFNVCMLPTIAFFAWWFINVYKNPETANFKNTMWMNVISCLSMIVFYVCLIFDVV